MTRPTCHHPSRRGFTIVEMLVSTALILFVMTILVSVFTGGIGALRTLRGVGNLQDQIRYATTILRRDLAAPHFGREVTPLAGPYLSQQRADLYDWTPPKEGFFRIYQGGPALSEGVDADGNPSYLMDTPEIRAALGRPLISAPTSGGAYPAADSKLHYLHFTVRLEPNAGQGTGRDRFVSTESFTPLLTSSTPAVRALAWQLYGYSKPDFLRQDGGTYPLAPGQVVNSSFYSPWAEVVYFIRPTGVRPPMAAPGTAQFAGNSKLYTLYRRKRLLVDARPAVTADALASQDTSGFAAQTFARAKDVSTYEVPSTPGRAILNTPASVRAPFRRMGMKPVTTPIGPTSAMPLEAAGINYYPGVTATMNDPKNQFAPHSFKTLYEEDASAGGAGGDDVLLENVLSWDVKAMWELPADPRLKAGIPVKPVTPYAQNPDHPFDDLPASPPGRGNDVFSNNALRFNPADPLYPTGNPPRVFDTWCGEDVASINSAGQVRYSAWNDRYEGTSSSTPLNTSVTIPLRVRVKAVQIRLRVWDTRTQQARQVTIVQDL